MTTVLTNTPSALFLWNTIAVLVYMTAVFAVAYRRKRLDTVDAAWGGGFVVVATLVAGLTLTGRSFLIAVLIDVWAVRLTGHIIERSRKHSEDDPRYVEIAKKWKTANIWPRAYVSIFLLQGLMVLLISLPVVFAAGHDNAYASGFRVVGTLVWVLGFIIEVVADNQLQKFIANKANKVKVLDTGLWRRTRHPNYLGEITQWYGIGIIACGARYGLIGLIGPVILNVLIRFISGVPPIERRKQKDPAYAAYMGRTNALLPKLRP